MKIRIMLARTVNDPCNAWLEIKTVPVDVPLDDQIGWQVVGADWDEQKAIREALKDEELLPSLRHEIWNDGYKQGRRDGALSRPVNELKDSQ